MVRIKTQDGRKAEIELDGTATYSDLLTQLLLKFDETPVDVSSGFPPRILTPDFSEQSLSSLGIKNGETLTVKLANSSAKEKIADGSQRSSPMGDERVMVLREMPDDNSCLFNAVGYVLVSKSREEAGQLRELVANLVLSDSSYDEAMLGRPPLAYAEWILQPGRWGGGIELALFARFYATEIASIDVATGRMDIFGEGQGYGQRVYLLYSGIHYDALALATSPTAPESDDITIFSPHDDNALMQAIQVADLAKLEHRYTDLARFTLRCEQCNEALVGEQQAEKHATLTGHPNFVEYQ